MSSKALRKEGLMKALTYESGFAVLAIVVATVLVLALTGW